LRVRDALGMVDDFYQLAGLLYPSTFHKTIG